MGHGKLTSIEFIVNVTADICITFFSFDFLHKQIGIGIQQRCLISILQIDVIRMEDKHEGFFSYIHNTNPGMPQLYPKVVPV